MSRATRSPSSSRRPDTTTAAPSAASRREIAAPIPPVEPVTSATLPSSRPAEPLERGSSRVPVGCLLIGVGGAEEGLLVEGFADDLQSDRQPIEESARE